MQRRPGGRMLHPVDLLIDRERLLIVALRLLILALIGVETAQVF